MTDIECPQCGHRALSVATRCPRCGHEFPEELLHRRSPAPGGVGPRPALLVAGAVAAVLGLALLLRRSGTGPPAPAAPPPAAVTAARTERVAEPAPDSPAQAGPAATQRPLLRFPTTWVNLRIARGPREPAVRVLNPGDSVRVDSLVGGWYRVLQDGRVVGYAHRRFLAPRHPADAPER